MFKKKFIAKEILATALAIRSDISIRNTDTTTEIYSITIKDTSNGDDLENWINPEIQQPQQGTTITKNDECGIRLEIKYNRAIYSQNRERIEGRIERELFNANHKYNATHDIKTGGPTEYFAQQQIDSPLAGIIFLDLDKFKQINDQYSYEAGDMVISDFYSLAQTVLKNHCNSSFYLCRAGGEEFVAYIIENREQPIDLDVIAQEILTETRARTIQYQEHNISYQTSIGVYRRQSAEENIEFTRKRAELAVKAAKKSGRNKSVNFEKIKVECGKIIESHSGTVILDLGSDVNIEVGDRFTIHHPLYATGIERYIFNDGRSNKDLGEIPKIHIATIETVKTNTEISFGVIRQINPGASIESGFKAHLEIQQDV